MLQSWRQMQSLWMSNCSVCFEACKLLSQKLPGLNVEVIDNRGHPDTRPESFPVEELSYTGQCQEGETDKLAYGTEDADLLFDFLLDHQIRESAIP
ncbi:hypothetical protein T459_15698 [Capsicum annuum]|uniref:Uncharacterized protein n=1 Tax=Capsicum annuum TaxID=4072 RepID=A0A2G2Z6M0_CAPAN|nr:hypothetical protein T459_15698 [Capsicum annuum]